MSNCKHECILAATRSATSLFCALIVIILIVLVFYRMEWTNSVHRLLLYILFASLLKLIAYSAQLVSVWSNSEHHTSACTGIGFTVQMTSWIVMLITFWLTVYLVFRYWWPNWEVLTLSREFGAWVGILVISTLVAVIPIFSGQYRSTSQRWCWISDHDLKGILQQWLLNYLWQIALSIAVIVLLVLTIWHSRRRANRSAGGVVDRNAQRYHNEAKEIRYLTGWVTGYLVLCVLTILIRLVDQVTIKGSSPFWMLVIFALMVPLGVLVLPLAFLIHLHRIRRFKLCNDVRESLLQSSHTYSTNPHRSRRSFQRLREEATREISVSEMDHSMMANTHK